MTDELSPAKAWPSMMSETPRTDAALLADNEGEGPVFLSCLCKTLERELAAAIRELTAQLDDERKQFATAKALSLEVYNNLVNDLEAERKAREEAERLFVEIRDKHQAEFLRAEAALAAIRAQEPVAWGVPNSRPTEKAPLIDVLLDITSAQYPQLLVPLYLHASADTEDAKRYQPLVAAAQNFIAKVDRGDAHSRDSYAKFKAALAAIDEARGKK